jgi:hypothetical protein
MKWLVTILAIVVGILVLPKVYVDTSGEVEVREALQSCEAAKRQAALGSLVPAQAPKFEVARQHTPAVDARLYRLAPNEVHGRETARRQCGLEAERLGRSALLWCAGV